jgi:hypothetical protein
LWHSALLNYWEQKVIRALISLIDGVAIKLSVSGQKLSVHCFERNSNSPSPIVGLIGQGLW